MSRIHDQHIDPCTNQGFDALVGVGTGAHRGTHPQSTEAVFASKGKAFGFIKILDGNHAAQIKVVVDHQDLLNAVLMK